MGKVRGLEKISNLKCHEQRAYLLYLLPTVFMGILPNEYLGHFNLFSESMYILLQENISKEELNKCDIMLDEFVKNFESLYGKSSVTIYIHMLRHVVSNVRALGPLWAISTFPYETNGGALKRLVKGTTSVLKQITSRYILRQSLSDDYICKEKGIRPVGTKKLVSVDVSHLKAFDEFQIKNSIQIFTSVFKKSVQYTSVRHPVINTIDYFVLFENNTIGKAVYYFEYKNKIYLLGELYTVVDSRSHIKQIKSSGCFKIKLVETIKDKLIYVTYKCGVCSTKEFIIARPNKFEKT